MTELHFFDPRDPATGYLSNFYRAPISLDGVSWRTVEHYYQAQKFHGSEYAERIRLAASSREAKEMGRTREFSLVPDWESRKLAVMQRALQAKFDHHADLRSRLLDTGDALLVEASPSDSFWGNGPDGKGRNTLGEMLVTLREQLRLQDSNKLSQYANPTESGQQTNAQWRAAAERSLNNLSDPSWRLLLREFCWPEKRVAVLWFLKNDNITQAVLRNLSRGMSQKVADDLLYDYKGRDPDQASPEGIESAIADLKLLLSLRYRLAAEKHIEGMQS